MKKKKLTAKQQETRDKLIFNEKTSVNYVPGQERRYVGGVRHFQRLPVIVLHELLRLGFTDPAEKQNDGPTLQEIVDLAATLSKETTIELAGYAVERTREDCRVSVDGVLLTGEINSSTRRLWWDLLKKHHPDRNEEEKNVLFAWWD